MSEDVAETVGAVVFFISMLAAVFPVGDAVSCSICVGFRVSAFVEGAGVITGAVLIGASVWTTVGRLVGLLVWA